MNIIKRFLICFSFFGFIFSACAQSFENVTTDVASELIKKNEGNIAFVILDVRTADEYLQGHIKNSVNIDFYNPDFAKELSKLEKSYSYLVYCRSGRRSASASEQMKALGFDKVANMLGGITKWSTEARPVEK